MQLGFHKVANVIETIKGLRDTAPREIGGGLFATAHVHPQDPTKVIKIGSGYANGELDGNPCKVDGYADWLLTMDQYQQKHGACEFMPRIDRATLFWSDDEARVGYVVVMERLRSFKEYTARERVRMLEQILVPSAMGTQLCDVVAVANAARNHDVTNSVTPGGLHLVSALSDTLSRRSSDLHPGNVMVRRYRNGSTVPVITDPVT